jgi:ABC-2 type transport system permease protein
LGVLVVQMAVLSVVAITLGWRPSGATSMWVVLGVILGWITFGAWGVLVGGWLRAEVTLAVANLVWFALLIAGGIGVPLDQLPRSLARVDYWLPSGALAQAVGIPILSDHPPPAMAFAVLAGWALLGATAAIRTFRFR